MGLFLTGGIGKFAVFSIYCGK